MLVLSMYGKYQLHVWGSFSSSQGGGNQPFGKLCYKKKGLICRTRVKHVLFWFDVQFLLKGTVS